MLYKQKANMIFFFSWFVFSIMFPALLKKSSSKNLKKTGVPEKKVN